MIKIKLHILHYLSIGTAISTWVRTTGEAAQISILIGVLSAVILILADILFQLIKYADIRRDTDVQSLNANFSGINERLDKLEE